MMLGWAYCPVYRYKSHSEKYISSLSYNTRLILNNQGKQNAARRVVFYEPLLRLNPSAGSRPFFSSSMPARMRDRNREAGSRM